MGAGGAILDRLSQRDQRSIITEFARHSRLLIVANQTCPCPALVEYAADVVERPGEVLVLAPALNSRARHWVSDTDAAAVARAQDRLAEALQALAARGVCARGEIGDADPFQAITDTLRVFDAGAIVVSTHPQGRSHWLERDLITRARAAFGVPIVHLESRYGLAVDAAAV